MLFLAIRRASSLIVCSLLTFLLLAMRVHAWEGDVHEGLTQWLAELVGFTKEDAQEIAKSNQEVDDDEKTDPVYLGMEVLMYNDRESSRSLHDFHFPSDGPLYGKPQERALLHRSTYATQRVDTALHTPREPKQAALRELGRALHTFQDSWSHEGVPDTPIRPLLSMWPTLAWYHPYIKGGWSNHYADLTHCYAKGQIEDMARATLRALEIFLSDSPKPLEDSEWTDILMKVGQFAEAATQEEKKSWFQTNGFDKEDARRLASQLNLPRPSVFSSLWHSCPQSEEPAAKSAWRSLPETSAVKSGAEFVFGNVFGQVTQNNVQNGGGLRYTTRNGGLGYTTQSGGLEDTVLNFLTAWIVKRDVDQAELYCSGEDIAAQLRPFKIGETNARSWIRKFLTLWLLPDHGLVGAQGHGFAHEGYRLLPDTPEIASSKDYGLEKYESLNEAIGWKHGKLYDLIRLRGEDVGLSGDETYAVVFRFNKIKRDAIVVVFQNREGFWRIVRIFNVVSA